MLISLSGPVTMVLVGDVTQRLKAGPHFRHDTQVYIGGVPCATLWVAADGTLMSVMTPSYAAICGSDLVSSCGQQVLTIVNPPLPDAALPSVAAALAGGGNIGALSFGDNSTRLGAAISCPPFCPGASASSGLPPMASYVNGQLVITTNSSSADAVTQLQGVGFYYAKFCTNYIDPVTHRSETYTDPSTGLCTNASSPAAAKCAFGSGGDTCQLCPTGQCGASAHV